MFFPVLFPIFQGQFPQRDSDLFSLLLLVCPVEPVTWSVNGNDVAVMQDSVENGTCQSHIVVENFDPAVNRRLDWPENKHLNWPGVSALDAG